MSPKGHTEKRVRSASGTRAALLEAAKSRFVRESYENVGIRDIAGDVGVDPALVSRYVGTKDELFGAVLGSCGDASTIWSGDPATFGERTARVLIDEPLDSAKLEAVLIMLRSAGSPKAEAIIRESISNRFAGPAEAYLGGGPDAAVHATLIGSVMMGNAIHRAIKGSHWLADAGERAKYRKSLAVALQTLIDAAIRPEPQPKPAA